MDLEDKIDKPNFKAAKSVYPIFNPKHTIYLLTNYKN